MGSITLAIVVLIAVALIGLFMRRGGDAPPTTAPPSADPASLDPEGSWAYVEDEGPDEEDVAVTSDGYVFVPDGDEVQIVPPREAPDPFAAAIGETSPVHIDRNTGALEEEPRGQALPLTKPGEHLDTGDLSGARVVRGAVGIDPWRVEALGREGEYRAWAFETEAAARAACELLRTRIVRPPLDEDGVPRVPDESDYAMALAMTERGVADLATDPDDET
jgi:hypothetical protein